MPVVLVIMDGWGLSNTEEGNAVACASTPGFCDLINRYPFIHLRASGEEVGLPHGQMGNSEVGHLNIGAGRIVYQELTRISRAIVMGDFFKNSVLLQACAHVHSSGGALHILGLLSDGGVHSHIEHLFSLLEMAKREEIERLFIHPILDGRDVSPTSAGAYLEALEEKIKELKIGKIATLSGRYYAMDRDKRWERTEKAYRAYVYREGEKASSPQEALEAAYKREETDEFVRPTVIGGEDGAITKEDSVIFFNFRPDRARQITRAFVDREFSGFDRGDAPHPYFVCMAEYDAAIKAPVAFPPEYLHNTLGEVVSRANLKQLRVAETEKYAHVTFFFNGGREQPFPGEERELVPSPKVPTYDLQPEMSAYSVEKKVLRALDKGKYALIVVNFANPDMVGHTGDWEAALKAVQTVDKCVSRLVKKVRQLGGSALITADHGNAERMRDEKGNPVTAHTANPVPFILVSDPPLKLKQGGILADIAPTVLSLLQLPKPNEMTGKNLIQQIGEVNDEQDQ